MFSWLKRSYCGKVAGKLNILEFVSTGKNINTIIFFFRTVSQMEGQQLANQFDCTFRETSAAEDFESVERVFNSLVRDVLHSKERQLPLQPLFISEDKTSLFGSSAQGALGNGAGRVRRTKSPKAIDSKDKKDEKRTKSISKEN